MLEIFEGEPIKAGLAILFVVLVGLGILQLVSHLAILLWLVLVTLVVLLAYYILVRLDKILRGPSVTKRK